MRPAMKLARWRGSRVVTHTATAAAAAHWTARRCMANTPGPFELFTSPAGLMAILYGRTGGVSIKQGNVSDVGSSSQKEVLPTLEATTTTAHADSTKGRREEVHHEEAPDGSGGDNSLFSKIRALLRQEAIFLALVIVVLSAVWELLSGQKSVVFQHVKDMFTVTLEVRSSQEEYAMIMDWMGRHPKGRRAHNLTLKPITVAEERSYWGGDEAGEHTRDAEARAVLVPGYGSHYFTHGLTRLWIARSEDETKKKSVNGGHVDRENDILQITFLTRRREVVESFLDDVRASWRTNVQNRIRIYANEQYGDSWKLLTERTRRPLETLFFPSPVLTVVDEIRAFLQLQHVYGALGIPWRRGYLFEGPPGTGKTSLVTALAGDIGLPIYVLSLQSKSLDDASLLTAVSRVPRRSILLIEDIENAIKTPSEAADSTTTVGGDGESGVSMSALLNALDGVASSEGRVLIITSNHPEALPSKEALLRPGRVDRRVMFSHMTETTQHDMERAFLSRIQAVPSLPPNALTSLNTDWSTRRSGDAGQSTSPAVVQQRLLEAVYAALQKQPAADASEPPTMK